MHSDTLTGMISQPSQSTRKAILYARFSPRRNADQCESIETQFDLCTDYCINNNLEIVAKFNDKALSGSDEDRPGLWSAMDALKRGHCLVVYRLDRLARSVYLSDIIERTVKKKGASIVSISGEGTWSDNDEDWLIRKILQTLAEYERKVIAARTKAAMLRHQANGKRMSKHPPYGFTVDPLNPGRLIEHETEQQVIQQIIAMKESGLSLRAICRELQEAGINCRDKTNWHHSTVQRIIQRIDSCSSPL
ncbi:DNA-invertase hin [Anaerohalosphaera lusitana]|uniref:DNA-invertase hin n=1 Tax=Anaerohalosphaera lusitana TaxID=1936003 RepID=A0A1U9NJR4_9BACT|nr:recombinase family protein [Anaerohalosphaera lusitana]AQT68055.1 DNA-invertase hin [Anaerohalosphaera lusitana]